MAHKASRRDFLYAGYLGGLGLTMADLFRAEQAQADQKFFESKEGTAKSVIFIFFPGGQAHQETWDPKPYAPLEYRGPMGSIATKVSGGRLNETLKHTAQIADKITVVNSHTHGEAAHERGTHNMFTGYRPSPALEFPSIGTVVSHEFGPRNNLPPYVCIPSQPNRYAGTGYLPSSFAPFSLGSDPASGSFTVKDLKLPGGVDDKRFNRRRSILGAVNDYFATREKAESLDAVDTFYERAYSLVSSKKAREAFDIGKEPKKLRDEYGRNSAGQRMLMARRLVEAGVRYVTLTYGGWDMHGNINGSIRGQMPAFDQAYARLIRDLDERGLLDSTMVCTATEFGRTPKINQRAARDHWPQCYFSLWTGAGIEPGRVIGESDRLGEYPLTTPFTPLMVGTTIAELAGINAQARTEMNVLDGGHVIPELM